MSLVFADRAKSLKNAVEPYSKIAKKDNKNKKATAKNVFFLFLMKN